MLTAKQALRQEYSTLYTLFDPPDTKANIAGLPESVTGRGPKRDRERGEGLDDSRIVFNNNQFWSSDD